MLAVALFFRFGRRLTPEEIATIAKKRRERQIIKYLGFRAIRTGLDREFKASMNADGRLHHVAYDLSIAPAVIASHLKYKKHEWLIWAFVIDRQVVALWSNKGPDATMVVSLLPAHYVAHIASDCGSSLVMRFHNHPNGAPSRHNYLVPSQQDLRSASYISPQLLAKDVSFIDFVCERGYYLIYYASFSEHVFPLNPIESEVISIANRGHFRRIALRFEKWNNRCAVVGLTSRGGG